VSARISFLAVVGALAVVAMACGPAAPTTGSYVAQFSNGAAYLAWTRAGSEVTGNFSQAIWREGDTALTNETFGITGSADGNGISLKLDAGLGLGPTAVGTLDGDRLTLTFPSANGKLSQYSFRPGTQPEFVALVAAVQAQVDTANAAAEAERQQQEAERQRQQAEAERQAALDRAVREAASALQATLDDATFQIGRYESAVQGMEEGIGAVKDAYETMLGDYSSAFVPSLAVRPMDDYQRGVVSYNLGALDYDRGVVSYQLDVVRSYHGDQATSARGQASTDLASIEAQAQALAAAVAANPSFVPAVTPSGARSMRDQLLAQVGALDKRRSAVLSTSNDYEKKADVLYAKAEKSAKAIGAV
jgi:hypothetical protein